MSDTPKDQDELSEKEAAKRRDDTLRRMLSTPPQPRKAKTTKNRVRKKSLPAKRGTGGGKAKV